jgi:transposase
LTEREFTKILDWPGYRVYRYEIDEQARRLKLWVRRKRGNKQFICSGCGGKASKIEEVREREVRDLPWRKYQTTVVVEMYRLCCPQCGLEVEVVPQLPSKAPFSKDFEDAVGLACESAAARQVARQFGLSASTVRAIDLRYLERWARSRRKPVLRDIGVDEIYLGKTQKFLTVVSNLETGAPLMVRPGSETRDAGRVLPRATHRVSAEANPGCLCGHVGAVHRQHSEVGAAVPDRLRQVSRDAACRQGRR